MFAHKAPSIISFKTSAKPKTPHFRQPKQKSALLVKSNGKASASSHISKHKSYKIFVTASLTTVNKDNPQNIPIEPPHFKRPLPIVKFNSSREGISSRVASFKKQSVERKTSNHVDYPDIFNACTKTASINCERYLLTTISSQIFNYC